MKYAEKIRDTYFENKDQINEHRKKLMLCSTLTLEHKLEDSYQAYKTFCREVGSEIKTKSQFLRSEVI